MKTIRSFGPRMRQPLVFLAVGLASTLANALLSMALMSLGGLPPVFAGAAAYLAMIFPTYLAQRSLTFGFSARNEGRFARYAALQMLGLGASAAANAAISSATPEFEGVYFFASLAFSAGFSFVIMRLWVFAAPDMAPQPLDQRA